MQRKDVNATLLICCAYYSEVDRWRLAVFMYIFGSQKSPTTSLKWDIKSKSVICTYQPFAVLKKVCYMHHDPGQICFNSGTKQE